MSNDTATFELAGFGNAAASQKDLRSESLLRMKTVIVRTGLSASTINRREAAGTFPRRRQIGIRCVAWYESEINEFIANPLRYQVL